MKILAAFLLNPIVGLAVSVAALAISAYALGYNIAWHEAHQFYGPMVRDEYECHLREEAREGAR